MFSPVIDRVWAGPPAGGKKKKTSVLGDNGLAFAGSTRLYSHTERKEGEQVYWEVRKESTRLPRGSCAFRPLRIDPSRRVVGCKEVDDT